MITYTESLELDRGFSDMKVLVTLAGGRVRVTRHRRPDWSRLKRE